MPPRILAIGDIHGCTPALAAAVSAADPHADDTVITLGDYIDRGPDSRGTIDYLIGLSGRCNLVSLLGNHDWLALTVVEGNRKTPNWGELVHDWLRFGGDATIASYGCTPPDEVAAELTREYTSTLTKKLKQKLTDSFADDVTARMAERIADEFAEKLPAPHLHFLKVCRLFYETDRHIFLHGNYIKELPLDQQPRDVVLWDSLRNRWPGEHCSGKTAILGHTSQKTGDVYDLEYLRCIDTWVYGDGYLTVLDVLGGQTWQADKEGNLRTP
jgi:serine/threonine protein phosphatase 1